MTSEVESQAKLLALTELSGIGDKRALALVEAAGGIDAVFEASSSTFADLHYVDEETYQCLQNLDEAIDEYTERIETATDRGVSLLTPLDDSYPDSLREHHSPLKLFYRGNRDLLVRKSISFAGSRDATDQTIEWTKEVSSALAEEGYCIVSGGAFGVDAAAHEGALDAGGTTIIASPSGHENPYPKANADLFECVERTGLVVSHRFPDETPTRGGFLYRNQTNSALSSSIVIAAAGEDGGSMAQYETAIDQGKQVFVPGEEIGAEPGAGLAQIRGSENVSSVSSASEIISELSSDYGQKTLTDW